jgi:hypothetical protein
MTEKYKIAVQLFGHLRTFKECAPSLYKYLLDKYDCDIFMHTWSMLNHNTKVWHSNNWYQGLPVNEEDVRKRYPHLKMIKIEEQHPEDWGNVLHDTGYNRPLVESSIFGWHAMLYSMAEANKLREDYEKTNGVKYDFVICTRPDILLKKDVDIDDLLASEYPKERDNGFFTFGNPFLKTKVICVCGFQSFSGVDLLFFARPNIISRVFAHLPNIKDIIKPGQIHRYLLECEFIKSIHNLGIVPYVINFSEYQIGRDLCVLRPEHRQIQMRAEDTLVKIIKAFVPDALLRLYRKLKGPI